MYSELSRLDWTVTDYAAVGSHKIAISQDVAGDSRFRPGIRTQSRGSHLLTSIGYPAFVLRDDVFVDGFVDWVIGGWISSRAPLHSAFLEIGCGDMRMARYLPLPAWYNAFDVSLSEFHIRRVCRRRSNVNLAIASVNNIPLNSNVAGLIVCAQVLEYLPRVSDALEEIHRIAIPGAGFLCSIANGYSHKYAVGGVHPGHVNRWTHRSFVTFMANHGFILRDSQMRGVWIRMPLGPTRTSYALPIPAREEANNTHLLFLFEVEK